LAEIDGEEIYLRGLVAKIDGTEILRGEQSGRIQDAEDIGHQLGEDLKSRAGPDFFPKHE
jgi:hydroxymethylbilane synthase